MQNNIIDLYKKWGVESYNKSISIKKELVQNQRYFHYTRNSMGNHILWEVTETEFIVYLVNINKEHSQKEKGKGHINIWKEKNNETSW